MNFNTAIAISAALLQNRMNFQDSRNNCPKNMAIKALFQHRPMIKAQSY
jgi:hypothetical protein